MAISLAAIGDTELGQLHAAARSPRPAGPAQAAMTYGVPQRLLPVTEVDHRLLQARVPLGNFVEQPAGDEPGSSAPRPPRRAGRGATPRPRGAARRHHGR